VTEHPAPSPERSEPAPTAVPFALALAIVGLAGVLAFALLRGEDEGRLVRPEQLDATGESTVQAVVADLPACDRLLRAQVDLADDEVFVELVAVEDEGCDERGTREVVAEVTLPQPVGDRALVSGVGRLRLPCTGRGPTVRCGPAR